MVSRGSVFLPSGSEAQDTGGGFKKLWLVGSWCLCGLLGPYPHLPDDEPRDSTEAPEERHK